jgi:Uma2 family endonuclease
MSVQVDKLMTAEDYDRLETRERTELVRGRAIVLVRPTPRHGRIANNIATALTNFVKSVLLGFSMPLREALDD